MSGELWAQCGIFALSLTELEHKEFDHFGGQPSADANLLIFDPKLTDLQN